MFSNSRSQSRSLNLYAIYMHKSTTGRLEACDRVQGHVKTLTPSFLSKSTPKHLVRVVLAIVFSLVLTLVVTLVLTLVFATIFVRWWLSLGLLRLIFVVALHVCQLGV